MINKGMKDLYIIHALYIIYPCARLKQDKDKISKTA